MDDSPTQTTTKPVFAPGSLEALMERVKALQEKYRIKFVTSRVMTGYRSLDDAEATLLLGRPPELNRAPAALNIVHLKTRKPAEGKIQTYDEHRTHLDSLLNQLGYNTDKEP